MRTARPRWTTTATPPSAATPPVPTPTLGLISSAHPAISGTRGRGLLRAVTFERPIAAAVATQARDAGFIINPVAPDAIRLAPPLIIGRPEVDAFVSALGPIADRAIEEMS